MKEWISAGLSKVLNFEVPDEMINYILSIDNETDFIEYMKTLLDLDNSQHNDFFVEVMNRKFPSKANLEQKQQKKKITKNSKPQQDFVTTERTTKPEQIEETAVTSGKKKKTKFVNLYSKEGQDAQVVLLKGRHLCQCEARDHKLVNNCMSCGRIVCAQEGSGPCLFCGTLVCTREEEDEINSQTKAGTKLKKSLMEQARPKGWEAAIAHRDRLLEYDRNSEQRTHVTDDDCDYFNTNSIWLNENERGQLEKYQQELHEKKHESRLKKKMTFDFAGRQVTEDTTIEHLVDLDKIRNIMSAEPLSKGSAVDCGAEVDRNVAFIQPEGKPKNAESRGGRKVLPSGGRVQDTMLREMSDEGVCVSMHQPWASLLVEGIKLHDGRLWYMNHRGRLWISSTTKPVDHEVVKILEDRYRVLKPDMSLKFPSYYPSGCLLGCVTVEDCLTYEEYQKEYPDGDADSDSPYVLICSNPISLRMRFPIKGQLKIYALEKTIHAAALQSMQTMAKQKAQEIRGG